MTQRIVLLNEWRTWINGLFKAFWSAVISSLGAAIGTAAGLLSYKDALIGIGFAVGTRVVHYLLDKDIPDIFVTEESVGVDGTVVTKTVEIARPEEPHVDS